MFGLTEIVSASATSNRPVAVVAVQLYLLAAEALSVSQCSEQRKIYTIISCLCVCLLALELWTLLPPHIELTLMSVHEVSTVTGSRC